MRLLYSIYIFVKAFDKQLRSSIYTTTLTSLTVSALALLIPAQLAPLYVFLDLVIQLVSLEPQGSDALHSAGVDHLLLVLVCHGLVVDDQRAVLSSGLL